MFKRKDLILILTILIITAVLSIIIYICRTTSPAAAVKITVDGKEYATYPLDQDRTIQIKNDYGENTIVILEKTVSIQTANCPDQICVKHTPIQTTNTPIICLPHKLVVEIIGTPDTPDTPDIISK